MLSAFLFGTHKVRTTTRIIRTRYRITYFNKDISVTTLSELSVVEAQPTTAPLCKIRPVITTFNGQGRKLAFFDESPLNRRESIVSGFTRRTAFTMTASLRDLVNRKRATSVRHMDTDDNDQPVVSLLATTNHDILLEIVCDDSTLRLCQTNVGQLNTITDREETIRLFIDRVLLVYDILGYTNLPRERLLNIVTKLSLDYQIPTASDFQSHGV